MKLCWTASETAAALGANPTKVNSLSGLAAPCSPQMPASDAPAPTRAHKWKYPVRCDHCRARWILTEDDAWIVGEGEDAAPYCFNCGPAMQALWEAEQRLCVECGSEEVGYLHRIGAPSHRRCAKCLTIDAHRGA